jgi:hypothetical protein
MWTSAFGTLYAILVEKLFVLTPSKHAVTNLLLHPITLNSLFLSPPAILLVTQIITSVYSAIAWSNVVHTHFKLIDLLVTLASQWSASGVSMPEEGIVHQAINTGTLFLKQKGISQLAFQRNAGTCENNYLWSIRFMI